MKPLHVGLLVVGAAIAGGLAVKMTEPLSLPLTAHPSFDSPKPVPAARPTQEAPQVPTPAPQMAAQPAVRSTPEMAVADSGDDNSAPPPIYSEPRHTPIRPPQPLPVSKRGHEQMAKVNAPPAPEPYHKMPEASADSQPAAPAPEPQPVPNSPSPAVQQIEQMREPQVPRQVTLEPGTVVPVRMLETLSSDRVSPGDAFSATLAEPLIIDGLIIAERGARVDGRVVNTARPSRVNGRSEIQLALTSITTADGQRVAISTEPWSKIGAGSGSTQAEEIGGGAALGAIIGAIAGGGKGAAIGAGIGSGAGVGAAIATKAKPVTVPSESVIRFRVNSRVRITERQL